MHSGHDRNSKDRGDDVLHRGLLVRGWTKRPYCGAKHEGRTLDPWRSKTRICTQGAMLTTTQTSMVLDMNAIEQARWSVVVPRDLDKDLRVYLAENGMRKGDLSKFIEEAVRWRLFSQTVAQAREGFQEMEPVAAQALIDEAIAAVRTGPPTPSPTPQ